MWNHGNPDIYCVAKEHKALYFILKSDLFANIYM